MMVVVVVLVVVVVVERVAKGFSSSQQTVGAE